MTALCLKHRVVTSGNETVRKEASTKKNRGKGEALPSLLSIRLVRV